MLGSRSAPASFGAAQLQACGSTRLRPAWLQTETGDESRAEVAGACACAPGADHNAVLQEVGGC